MLTPVSVMTAVIKAVAVAMAFSVDGVVGMIAGRWARPGRGAVKRKIMAIVKYRPGFVMVQM